VVEALPEPTSALADEIERALLARLPSLMKARAPRRIAYFGACSGVMCAALRALYPDAVWMDAVDGANTFSTQAHTFLAPFSKGVSAKPTGVCLPQGERGANQNRADAERADLVLGMPAAADRFTPLTSAMFRDIKNALADNGVFLFATLGPQTLLPLQALCSPTTASHTFASWPTLVDLGNALVAAGLARPVLDCETLTFTYASAADALDELARDGWINTTLSTTLHTTSCAQDAARALTVADGSAAVPFEIFYGVAWNRSSAVGRSVWQPLRPQWRT